MRRSSVLRSILAGEPSHAYLLEGEEAGEREAFAKELISGLLCTAPERSLRPCGVCPSCRKIRGGSHEDLVIMEPSGANGYKVQDAEKFISRLRMSPYGERMAGWIPSAELMSEVIQNKLLKTIEEPNPGTVIVLTTQNRAGLLETVRSRCVLLRLDAEPDAGRETQQEGPDVEIFDAAFTHEFRKGIEKKIKNREDALAFLDVLEERASEWQDEHTILRTEIARKDILAGMGYKQALKRLYLECH